MSLPHPRFSTSQDLATMQKITHDGRTSIAETPIPVIPDMRQEEDP
jgi:hypothetical protein